MLASQTARWLAGLMMAVAALVVWAQQAQRPVLVLVVDGVIGPATSDFIYRGLEQAREQQARLVVLQMDTPGGLDTSMRAIIKDILASPVPVATYVAPEGARAASAGTYILYASHIAAMAPATNLGAATPVAIGIPGTRPGGTPGIPGKGGDKAQKTDDKHQKVEKEESLPADAMMAKAINDAAAYIRSLAQLRGRNADFAEQAVRQARSLSATEAIKGGVIDLVANDLPDLLQKLEGREVTVFSGKTRFDLKDAVVQRIDPDWRSKLLGVLSNPTLAVALMLIGVYGLFVEFTSPGFGVPGVAGAIALLLGLYALHLLPVNWVGLGLLLLGTVLMIAEVFMPSFGVLGVGGIAAFVFGGLMLFDTQAPGFGLPAGMVVAMALASATAILGFGTFALRARKRPVVSGVEQLPGMSGVVVSVDGAALWVRVEGELWQARRAPIAAAARQPHELRAGDAVSVCGRDGLTLLVEPAEVCDKT